MITILVEFVALLLAMFTLCLTAAYVWARTRDLRAWDERQRKLLERENEAAWRRNQKMVMN